MLEIDHLHVQAGSFSLTDVSLTLPPHTYAVLMGKTGSGKTTLLEAVAGLRPVRYGRILLHGVDVTHRRPADRNLGYVPQDGALFPTMTVWGNLAFALTVRHIRAEVIQQRVEELAEMLEIGHLLPRSVHGLSGGEKQRVSLGRALAFQPSTLCLDEPLSALDDETRQQMYSILQQVRHATGVTVLHVTHSLDEARHLADRLFRVEDGEVRELLPE